MDNTAMPSSRDAASGTSGDRSHSKNQNNVACWGFNFVTIDPSSDMKSSASRALIRANAGRYVWQCRKAKGEQKAYGMKQPPEVKKARALNTHRVLPSAGDVEEGCQTGDRLEESGAAWLVQAFPQGASLSSGQCLNPTAGFHHGLRTPFARLPTEIHEGFARRSFNYASSVILTKMFLHTPGSNGGPADLWPAYTMRNPALFSSFIYATACHEYAMQRLAGVASAMHRRRDRLQMITAQHEAVQRINESLKDPLPQLDELIMAVFFMGFSCYNEATFDTGSQSHRSPLRNIQWAEIYSHLDHEAVHVAGLCHLIALRGGFDAIKLDGLPQMLSLGAIMGSSKFLVTPLFPYVPIIQTNGRHTQPDWPPYIACYLESGSDFSELPDLGIPMEMVDILHDMSTYHAVVDLYARGILADLDIPALADRRNSIQHRVLSLPTANERGDLTGSPIYEPLRLTTIIYSLLTVFALAPPYAPFYRLSRLLQQSLVDLDFEGHWKWMHRFYIWALVAGGVASRDNETNRWFVSALRDAAAVNDIRCWFDLKQVLTSVMWLATICDELGEDLWSSVLQSQVEICYICHEDDSKLRL